MTSSLVAVLAQRLVRMICTHCRVSAGDALHARRRDDRDLPRRGLRALLRHRLHGARRHLRDDGVERRDPPQDHGRTPTPSI